MSQLKPLQSIYFRVNGKTFKAIGCIGTAERDDCIDIIKEQSTGKRYQTKRSHITRQQITWLTQQQYEETENIHQR